MYLTNGWTISVFSGTTLLLAVLSINIVGESLSEIIDPALRRR
jgi:ABC-type dipeptide/oligopeptide/nickel transport system permease subunit